MQSPSKVSQACLQKPSFLFTEKLLRLSIKWKIRKKQSKTVAGNLEKKEKNQIKKT